MWFLRLLACLMVLYFIANVLLAFWQCRMIDRAIENRFISADQMRIASGLKADLWPPVWVTVLAVICSIFLVNT